MKALCLVVSEKKIFENWILKTYLLTPWPTYATNWNGLNNFGRGTPRDPSCEVWAKSNERFQRRIRLNEKVYAHTHWMTRKTDKEQWTVTIAHSEHFVLRWAKNERSRSCSLRQDFRKFYFKNIFFDPMTYLSNQLKRFEQLW